MTWLHLALAVTIWIMPGTPAGPLQVRAEAMARNAVAWYARMGIAIDVAGVSVRTLAGDPCVDQRWWMADPTPDGARLYLVDARCPVYGHYYGIASPWRRLAVVSLGAAPVDVIVAHELAHLLGARDDLADGRGDLMSPCCYDVAYAHGYMSLATWAEMGGEAPATLVVLPMVQTDGRKRAAGVEEAQLWRIASIATT